MIKKDARVGGTVDAEAARLLSVIAQAETESNMSLALRRVIREAAAARGLIAVPAAGASLTGQTANGAAQG